MKGDQTQANGRPAIPPTININVQIEHRIRVEPPERSNTRGVPAGRKCLEAMVLRLEHPDWSQQKIADAIGVDRRQLYRWPQYLRLCELFREVDRLRPDFRDVRTDRVDAIV